MKTWKGIALAVGAVALVPAATLLRISYRRDLDLSLKRISAGSVVQTKCGPIEYAVRGEGPPVLVVHGAGGGFDQGLAIGEGMPGFQIIAPSRFGYLRTPLPDDASPEAQADAHACLLDALHVTRAAVVGVSAGGPSTLQFCLRHAGRCAALLLLVPMAWSDRPAETARLTRTQLFFIERTLESDFLFWAGTRLFRDRMIESILGTPLGDVAGASPADQRRIYAMLDSLLPVSRRAQGLRNEGVVARSLRRYELEKITAPTLIASVEDDGYLTYEPARYTAEHIPGARFIGYARGGHMLVGHQQELWDEARKLLADQRLPREADPN